MRIYLDNNASTRLSTEVYEAMQPYLREHFGNPSTLHWAGAACRGALASARQQIADFLGASSDEIVLTSGGSESNNHAIKGVLSERLWAGNGPIHAITTVVEHPAVSLCFDWAERFGIEVTRLEVDKHGLVSVEQVREALRDETALVSVMHANNEVGTIQPVEAIGRLCRQRGVVMHTDAAQSAGKIPTKVDELSVDLLTLAGHKFHAPKGVGALYIRKGTRLASLIDGAGHESGRRAGTENVASVVGLGEACRLAAEKLDAVGDSLEGIEPVRDYFHEQLAKCFGQSIALNGHPTKRLPNTLNISFVGRFGADVLAGLDGVAASTGSACHDGSRRVSPVLAAMGVEASVAHGAVRFSLGWETTREEIDEVVRQLDRCLNQAS